MTAGEALDVLRTLVPVTQTEKALVKMGVALAQDLLEVRRELERLKVPHVARGVLP